MQENVNKSSVKKKFNLNLITEFDSTNSNSYRSSQKHNSNNALDSTTNCETFPHVTPARYFSDENVIKLKKFKQLNKFESIPKRKLSKFKTQPFKIFNFDPTTIPSKNKRFNTLEVNTSPRENNNEYYKSERNIKHYSNVINSVNNSKFSIDTQYDNEILIQTSIDYFDAVNSHKTETLTLASIKNRTEKLLKFYSSRR